LGEEGVKRVVGSIFIPSPPMGERVRVRGNKNNLGIINS
jgi:hypothetical protein